MDSSITSSSRDMSSVSRDGTTDKSVEDRRTENRTESTTSPQNQDQRSETSSAPSGSAGTGEADRGAASQSESTQDRAPSDAPDSNIDSRSEAPQSPHEESANALDGFAPEGDADAISGGESPYSYEPTNSFSGGLGSSGPTASCEQGPFDNECKLSFDNDTVSVSWPYPDGDMTLHYQHGDGPVNFHFDYGEDKSPSLGMDGKLGEFSWDVTYTPESNHFDGGLNYGDGPVNVHMDYSPDKSFSFGLDGKQGDFSWDTSYSPESHRFEGEFNYSVGDSFQLSGEGSFSPGNSGGGPEWSGKLGMSWQW